MSIRIGIGNADDGGYILKNKIHITMRELEALSLIAMGLDNESLAKKLNISVNTVRNHIYNVMQKLEATNRAHAVAKAIENGILIIKRQDTLEWPPDDYLYCLICEKAYRVNELFRRPERKVIINHVEYELEADTVCPYCQAEAAFTIEWKEVREQNSEYPMIPESGIRYDYKLVIRPEDNENIRKMKSDVRWIKEDEE